MVAAMRDLIHPADRLADAMDRIYSYRMTTTSGGNLSIRDEDGSLWITPARVDKGALRRDDIVKVLPDGSFVGRHKPSSEFPFHHQIYAKRPYLGALVHAHPVALVAFSICGRCPDTRVFAKAHSICGDVGFAPYALPGSALLGERIAEVFAQGYNCVMLENHGVVVGGKTFQEAFERFETLEFAAKTIVKASPLGDIVSLPDEKLQAAQDRGPIPESFEPPAASEAERALRRDLCDFVRRGYEQRLLISTEGTFSARIDEDSFVITPRRVDRAVIAPEDLVLVSKGRAERGKVPSRAVGLHAAIYERHATVRSILNATPVNATAFAISATALDTRTIPESYIFLRDVPLLDSDEIYHEYLELAARLDPAFPVSLVANDGAMVLGTSILDAFDRLEVLEATAEAILNARPLGALKVMGKEVIDELIEAFLKK